MVRRPWARISRSRAGAFPATSPPCCAILSPCSPESRARRPAGSAMLPPTSRPTAGPSATPTSTASRTASRPGSPIAGSVPATCWRSCCRPAPSTWRPTSRPPSSARSPPGSTTVSHRASVTRSSPSRTRRSSSPRPGSHRRPTRRSRRSRARPASTTCSRRSNGSGVPDELPGRSRPPGRDRLHVGHHRPAQGRPVHRAPARLHHRDRRRRHVGWRDAELHGDLVRSSRVHDQAARQPHARRDDVHHAALAGTRLARAARPRAHGDGRRGSDPARADARRTRLRRVRPRRRSGSSSWAVDRSRRTSRPPARERFGAALATRYSCTEAGIGLGTAFDDPERGRDRQRRPPPRERRPRGARRRRPAGPGRARSARSASAPPR